MKTAFIIGNGPTRTEVDLNKLVGKGTIFGCNALYRDFTKYDYLVSIDKSFQKLLEAAGNEGDYGKVIFPPEDECFEDKEFGVPRRRSNAGMNAMIEAIKLGHTKLFCLGFDFLLADEKKSTDNIYKNTEGYGIETHANATDNIHRVSYLNWFMNKHKDIRFTFVLPEEEMYILTTDNAYGINIQNFIKHYGE